MQLVSSQLQERIITIIEKLTQDWDGEFDGAIGPETQLVQDIDFASIDFVQLVVAIEDAFQQKLGFHELLMQNGQYVDDLSVAQISTFVETKLNEQPFIPDSSLQPNQSPETDTEALDAAKITQFRQIVESRVKQLRSAPAPSSLLDQVSGKTLFILSPPRSGSTLLRVVLGGHPMLFAPPELHLLSYDTLTQRKDALVTEHNAHLRQGTIRAIMQLKDCPAETAEQFMQGCENQQLTTLQFYKLMRQWMGDRILVDKSPTYASHLDILQHAEADFEDPVYIHLLRHPYGMIRSYEESKLDRIAPIMHESSFSRRELAELTWLVSHQNILKFLDSVPQHRQLRVKYEDLVSRPQSTVQSICNVLNIDFHPDMLDPYQEKQQRMTDGVQVVSQMSGDLKFHLHQGIDASAANRWKQFHTSEFLGDATRNVTQLLDYALTP